MTSPIDALTGKVRRVRTSAEMRRFHRQIGLKRHYEFQIDPRWNVVPLAYRWVGVDMASSPDRTSVTRWSFPEGAAAPTLTNPTLPHWKPFDATSWGR